MSRKLGSFDSRKKCCQAEKRSPFPKNMVETVTNETVHSCSSIPEHSSSKHGNACESWHTLDICHLADSEAFIISDTLKNNRAKHTSFPAAFLQKELDLAVGCVNIMTHKNSQFLFSNDLGSPGYFRV